MRALELSGKRFGRLVVLSRRENSVSPGGVIHATWLCKCDCGGETVVQSNVLISGRKKSCGCLHQNTTHGHAIGGISPEYAAWRGAKQRCCNPKDAQYHNYGGRGISICNEWLNSFETFLLHMGPRPDGQTLDRIDVDGNYEPGNCRWVSRYQQANNMRKNRWISIRGELLTVSQAASKYGLPCNRVYERLNRGWPVERALDLTN